MTKQLLIYNQVTPINNEKHRNWSIKRDDNYQFSQDVDVVPLMASEFSAAAKDYAIVFIDTEDNLLPVVILSIQAQKNLYLTPEKKMESKIYSRFFKTLSLCFFHQRQRF